MSRRTTAKKLNANLNTSLKDIQLAHNLVNVQERIRVISLKTKNFIYFQEEMGKVLKSKKV